MAHVAQTLTQEPIYKPSSIFCFKPILLSAHKLILLIYGDNTAPTSPVTENKIRGGHAPWYPSSVGKHTTLYANH